MKGVRSGAIEEEEGSYSRSADGDSSISGGGRSSVRDKIVARANDDMWFARKQQRCEFHGFRDDRPHGAKSSAATTTTTTRSSQPSMSTLFCVLAAVVALTARIADGFSIPTRSTSTWTPLAATSASSRASSFAGASLSAAPAPAACDRQQRGLRMSTSSSALRIRSAAAHLSARASIASERPPWIDRERSRFERLMREPSPDVTRMFLDRPRGRAVSRSASRADAKNNSNRRRTQPQPQPQQQPQQPFHDAPSSDTRVLGFDILSQLSASSVDMGAWGTGEDTHETMGTADPTTTTSSTSAMWLAAEEVASGHVLAPPANFFPSPGMLWNSQDRPELVTRKRDDSLFVVSPAHPAAPPAWFPRTPTRSQIDMLKVAELKEACAQRGLKKSGNKLDLQERLWKWTIEQQETHRARLEDRIRAETSTLYEAPPKKEKPASKPEIPNTLQEWIRNADLKPFLKRREQIKHESKYGKPREEPKMPEMSPTKDYLMKLTKAIQAPSAAVSSNVQANELYAAAKKADQLGERAITRQLLETLLEATPNDGRLYRRLSRMSTEDGDITGARNMLMRGTRQLPENAFLWHGLGQLEQKHGSEEEARRYFQKAIATDQYLAHPYHALGLLEHSKGHIAKAMSVVQQGIRYCPQNHRLHHALGDLFRNVDMLDRAKESYEYALEFGPTVSRGFAYTALAAVAYEDGRPDQTRYWLRKSVTNNKGRNAMGWVALSQFEEAEGNIEAARATCIKAVTQYERGLLSKQKKHKKDFRKLNLMNVNGKSVELTEGWDHTNVKLSSDSIAQKNRMLAAIPSIRPGDQFLKVFDHWIRLEKRHGDFESVTDAYERATVTFGSDYRLLLDWAEYSASTSVMHERTRQLYMNACNKVGQRHADPYRSFAEFEMGRKNYAVARGILYRGARAVSESPDGDLSHRRGLAELFHAWAVCEWHLGNVRRAEVLFDHALRSAAPGAAVRSQIFYSIATLEYNRGQLYLAQHCIGLSLIESDDEGVFQKRNKAHIWRLWERVATEMGNADLAKQCKNEASKPVDHSFELNEKIPDNLERISQRQPWQEKLFGSDTPLSKVSILRLPRKGDQVEKKDETTTQFCGAL